MSDQSTVEAAQDLKSPDPAASPERPASPLDHVWAEAPNFQEEQGQAQTEAALRRMLEHGKPYFVPREGAWYLSRHQDIEQLLRDKDTSSDRLGWFFQRLPPDKQEAIGPLFEGLGRWLVNLDEPAHRRIRAPMQRAFASSILRDWEDWLHRACRQRIEALTERDAFEAIAELALPIPLLLICEMLGMSEDDSVTVKRHYEAILHFIDHTTDPQNAVRAMGANARLNAYFQAKLAGAGSSSDLSLLKHLAALKGDLQEEDIVANAALIVGAGHETTASLMAAALWQLYQHEGLCARLADAPPENQDALLDAYIEEILRLYPPVQRTSRVLRKDTRVQDVVLPAGSRCVLMLGAANRDPAVFEAPETLRLDRGRPLHLSFSSGTHYCLGAHVARLEARILLRHFLPHAAHYTRVDEPLEWVENSTFRCLKKLTLRRSGGQGTQRLAGRAVKPTARPGRQVR